MRRSFLPTLPLLSLSLLPALASPAFAQWVRAQPTSPGMLCRSAISQTERRAGVPDHLLAAIGRVESGRPDPQTGEWHPWPWTINAEGQGYFFDSKAQAIAAVRALQEKGVHSIDVGCMQVNLMHHPNAFASLEQAFDPQANVTYAAAFLNRLYAQSGNWTTAAALYHSATPELAADYQRRVLAVWPEEKKHQRESVQDAQRTTIAAAWASTLPVASSTNRVTVFLPPNRSENIRVIPLSPGGQGRGLDAYRARPIVLASPSWRRSGG